MSYIIETPDKYRPGKTDAKIDLPRFAADLAKALGGTVRPPGDYPNERQEISVGADVVSVSADNWKKRVRVFIAAPDVSWDDRNTYDKGHRTEDATVNPDGRTIERIAADIRKRVIDASQPALALQREHAAMLKAARTGIVEQAAALKKAIPQLDIRVNERERTAAIYSGANLEYLSARLNADGTVSVDRLHSMSRAKFERLVTLLNSKD